MTNTKAVDVSKIKQGDRVLISKGFASWAQNEWGTVGYERGNIGTKVYMDNLNLSQALAYSDGGNDGAKCYYAADEEILQHIPAAKVAMHEGRPVNVEDHGQPNPLTVHDDIQATLDFLHATTHRKWKATTKDVCLELDGTTTYAGSITISFTEDK